jgi:cytochrome c biogenesis protein CcdA
MFVWLGQWGRKFRTGIAAVVGLVSPQRAPYPRAGIEPAPAGNITAANSFCAGLGLSVSCLTCMGGAILYPLLILWAPRRGIGSAHSGTYSLALAIPMAVIAVAVGNWSWQFVHRPWLTRGLNGRARR